VKEFSKSVNDNAPRFLKHRVADTGYDESSHLQFTGKYWILCRIIKSSVFIDFCTVAYLQIHITTSILLLRSLKSV